MEQETATFTGEVIWFGKSNGKSIRGNGIGFIKRHGSVDGEPDMFVHFSDIEKEGFKSLNAGDVVQYGVGKNLQGEPKAINVKVLTAAPVQETYQKGVSGKPYAGKKESRW